MAGRWETHRGDEWWYNDYWCKLDAGFNSAYPGTFSIDKAEFKGQLTESRLHHLLWSTQQQFKDSVIEVCALGEHVPVLQRLQNAGQLKTKKRDSTYSKCIQITDIVAPPQSSAVASAPTSKKPWWRFW